MNLTQEEWVSQMEADRKHSNFRRKIEDEFNDGFLS
jgi:hypothetical protein